MANINTKEYWEERFSSGDWEQKKGRRQTRDFALSQIHYLHMDKDFAGKILDFGCGLGDAVPIYHEYFPHAQLVGVDISESAVNACKEVYGDICNFYCGGYEQVQDVDVIIASNVFEHLKNDREIARLLLTKCSHLYIFVPYNEEIQEGSEHVHSYDEHSFSSLGSHESVIFYSKGWSHHGLKCLWHIHIKNIVRFLLGKKIVKREKQIMYHFS